MAVVASCAIVGGATFAIFTDSSSANMSAANQIMAGKVDIDSYRDGFDTIPGPMFYTTSAEGSTPTQPSYPGLKPTGYWAPGDTNIRSLIVYNKGGLDAVLKQVYVDVEEDSKNLASQMDVAVYKILPKYLPNGTPFAAIPGDDTLDEDLLNQASNTFNPFIRMMAAFGVEDLAQKLIEKQIPLNAEKLWSGPMTDLTSGYQDFTKIVNMKSKNNSSFTKRGCLLAFVVHLDKNAGNDYKDAVAKFGFTVMATSK